MGTCGKTKSSLKMYGTHSQILQPNFKIFANIITFKAKNARNCNNVEIASANLFCAYFWQSSTFIASSSNFITRGSKIKIRLVHQLMATIP